MALDLPAIRRQFPILRERINGHPLVYLDSAATAQKPSVVLEAMDRFYRESNANAHRSMHVLAERATLALEESRGAVARFIEAPHPEDIVFTKSCTEAINLIAKSWGRTVLKEGDGIVLSLLEHHSNIVPWLQLKEERGIELRWIDVDDEGKIRVDQLEDALERGNVRLVTITAQSNVLGVRPPLPMIIERAHRSGALVLVDAAQMIAHAPLDVSALDCDFLAFSAHKLYGPMGIGVLYAKRKHWEAMSPWIGGGGMVRDVRTDGFTPAEIPQRFEGGTQAIAEAVGLHAAITWLRTHVWEDIANHEHALIAHACERLEAVPGLQVIGTRDSAERFGCISFTTNGMHPHDLTEILGREGMCLRAGHHCAQPLHRRFNLPATTRLSIGIYNTMEDIDRTAEAIEKAAAVLAKG